jgi:hypothetical protein
MSVSTAMGDVFEGPLLEFKVDAFEGIFRCATLPFFEK